MPKRKVTEKYIEVSIAMKVAVGIPDYKMGEKTPYEYATKLAKKMLAAAGAEMRKVNGNYSVATDFKTLEADAPRIFSTTEVCEAPRLDK